MKNTNYIQSVKKWLCSYTGRQHCILTGRGTTAIHLILHSLKEQWGPGKIVMPPIIAPSVPNTVLYSGYEPIFCDVNLHDFNMDVDSLEKVIESEKNVKGVIPVHLYGQPADMDRILQVSSDHDLFVIEDAAQALGAEYKNKKCGAFGDASIMSFGHTKILDCGGGGAILTDNDRLFKKINSELKKFPSSPENLEKRSELYRQVYYMLKPIMDLDDELNRLFFEIPSIFKDIFLYKIEEVDAKRIHSEIRNLDFYVSKRRENANEYRKRLQHPQILHPRYTEKGVYWRYSFLLKSSYVREVTEAVRSHGVDISNWYPPLHRWYKSGRKQNPKIFSNAVYIGDHVINLWTIPSLTKEKIKETSDIFLRVVNEFENRG